jgi:branched-chain amino acid transport system substrate-binding protein
MTRNTKQGAKKLLGMSVAVVLVAAACGSDDDSSSSTDAPEASDAPAESDAPDATEAPSDAPADTDAPADSGDGEGVRLGIMGECEGGFAGFSEDVVAGASLAMINGAGATSNSPTTAMDGFSGASVAGTDIELVGIGCGDDTADRAIQEIRTLVEQDGANVVIGPLSGDEGIAIANYALDHPEVTFINGIAGAQDATLHVRAPNFFRFNGDGAQWNAGLGDFVYNENGWRTAAVIADDYGFGWTSSAGMVADFCAAGGEIVSYVYPPLNGADYASFVEQLPDPDEVDGYFWAVGGDVNASLQAFVNSKGDIVGEQFAGNLFFDPNLAEAIGTGIAGAYVGGFASLPGDITTPEITAYLDSADAAWDTLTSGAMTGGEPGAPSGPLGFGFGYGFYTGGLAFVEALDAVGGDLSDNHAALREELSTMTLDAPYGPITLDENRQAIVDTAVTQLFLNDEGELDQKTVAIIPGVDQTFGGTFSTETDPPERDNTSCEVRELPWQGNSIPVVDGVPQR